MSKFFQKGVSLYLSIMIMVILLAIVLGISGILLGQLKTMKGIENSVVAFYAAETGIEKVLVDRRTGLNTNIGHYDGSIGSASYEVEVLSPGPNCDADNYCISSVGTYNETKRGIQVKY